VPVEAERAFLAELGGGCDLPCGAYATIDGRTVTIDALLATLDGHIALRAREHGDDPVAVGVAVARRLLDRDGGRALLDLEGVSA
jgi:hydroxymethylbilane synthase